MGELVRPMGDSGAALGVAGGCCRHGVLTKDEPRVRWALPTHRSAIALDRIVNYTRSW